MTHQLIAAIAPLALLLGLAAPAPGAVRVDGSDDGSGTAEAVTIVDRGATANRLAVTVDRRRVVVRERGRGELRATGACRVRSARVAVCRVNDPPDVAINAGRNGDRVEYRSAYGHEAPEIDGGAGDDTISVRGVGAALVGGPGRDTLRGGERRDDLYGGPGRDALHGGAGRDVLDGDGWLTTDASPDPRSGQQRSIAADRLDGGPGRDMASWAVRRRPVAVDLAAGTPAGVAGEGDRLRSIEGAAGGLAADRLRGDGGPNVLYGGAGADLLDGRGGRDVIDAGDRAPDSIGDPDGDLDRIRCGRGRDGVADAGRHPIGRDCERLVEIDYGDLSRTPLRVKPRPAGRRRVRVEVPAAPDADARESYRQVILRAGGREIGRSRLARLRTERAWLLVRLRRPLPSRGVMRVIFVGEDEDDENEFAEPGDPPPPNVPFRFEYRVRR